MKEILVFIRQGKVNQTKKALAEAGYPSLTCRKVLGRGKKLVNFEMVQTLVQETEQIEGVLGEHLSESTRLIPKRAMTLIVNDCDVNKVVETIIETNSTGHQGDGKIFQLPVSSSYRIRDGEVVAEAY